MQTAAGHSASNDRPAVPNGPDRRYPLEDHHNAREKLRRHLLAGGERLTCLKDATAALATFARLKAADAIHRVGAVDEREARALEWMVKQLSAAVEDLDEWRAEAHALATLVYESGGAREEFRKKHPHLAECLDEADGEDEA